MTLVGEYFNKKSVSKAEIARKTGISKARLSELSNNPNTHIRATELYLIALAIDADPTEFLNFVCKDLKLLES
ncbi:MAG: helix-turn-helix transcriptional regulator [Cytophagales bacterium]|nr:helix-turn-helix transcriptional regulator [Cytophagales bacterium]